MTDKQELEYSLNTDSVSRFVMYVEAKKDITILDDSCSDILLKCFYIKATNIASFILDFDKQLNYSCFKEFKGVPFCTTYTPFLFFLWQDSVSLFRDNKNFRFGNITAEPGIGRLAKPKGGENPVNFGGCRGMTWPRISTLRRTKQCIQRGSARSP